MLEELKQEEQEVKFSLPEEAVNDIATLAFHMVCEKEDVLKLAVLFGLVHLREDLDAKDNQEWTGQEFFEYLKKHIMTYCGISIVEQDGD